jgi:two-component system, OmpR family, sensor histidine kinase KdpD
MKHFLKYALIHFLYRHLAALLLIALITLLLLPLNAFLGPQLTALIYLLPVMISTVFFGLTPGVLAGFAAFLVFNYFFITPYHTFMVHKTQDLITLIIFLIVAVVMSQLIGQAREGMRLARSREWEATRMYELISALSGAQDTQNIARVLARQTLEAFRLDRSEVYIEGKPGESSYLAAFPEDSAAPGRPATQVPLLTARGMEGELRLWHDREILFPPEKRMLEAFASQGALAIERIRLMKGENRAHVLEESDKLKSALLSSVSHELRSPLAAIKASVSSLRGGAVDWDTAARQDLLATVEEETDHLNLLVGNLLDMSRIESGVLRPQKRWNSIAEIAAGVATRMRKQLSDHRLVLDLPASLPLVATDYVMMQQVFTNLISNSVKYAPAGTSITIAARQEGDFLEVLVSNQGPPVPEEHLQRIFDKFYRVTLADRVTGTGLGLSICKGIIEAHGGRIWAQNQPCCFEFHFNLPFTMDGALPSIPKEDGDG